MKRIGKYILAASFAAMGCNAMAQGLNSAYFIEDYKFRHTMNPAFDNEQNYVSIPALGNLNVRTQGNFGIGDVLFDNPRYGIDSDKKKTTFMNPYISTKDALAGFASGTNRINADVDITILSAGFKKFGGYNTISLDARTNVGMALPYSLFEFAKNTGNKTYIMDDINVHAQSFVQLAFLAGEDKWTMQGSAKANISMKGFAFKQEEKEYKQDGKGTYKYVNDIDIDGPGLGGFGMAFDLGAVYKINDDWQVSASLVDLGFISWSNNVTAVNKQETFEFNGFHDISYDKHDANGNLKDNSFESQGDKYGDQLADFANLTDEGDRGGRTTGIGATLNVGAEYTFPLYRKLKFGLLSSTRFNGKYTWTEGRLSANVSPLKWIDGGINFALNSYTASCGWVLNVHPKGFNMFIGMDHILGKMSKEFIPLSSNASVNLGFNVTF